MEKVRNYLMHLRCQVERVNPLHMAANLSSIVASRVLAYGAMAMVVLHRGLQFKGEMADEKENRNWMVKDLGNISAESECSFGYGFRPKSECDLTGVKEIPFQVQLLYTRPDGMQCLRVATTTVAVTDDRQEAEANADVRVIGTHAVHKAAKFAKDGDYEAAQMEARAAQRFIVRNNKDENLDGWVEQTECMDKVLRSERAKEEKIPTRDQKMRQKTRNDDASTAISRNTQVASKKFWGSKN